MAEEAHVLGMAVDEDKHLRPAAYATDADAPGSTVGYTVAHHATAGGEEAGDLLVESGEDGGFVTGLQRLAAYDGEGHREMAYVGLVACAGDHDIAEGVIRG